MIDFDGSCSSFLLPMLWKIYITISSIEDEQRNRNYCLGLLFHSKGINCGKKLNKNCEKNWAKNQKIEKILQQIVEKLFPKIVQKTVEKNEQKLWKKQL